MRPATSTRSDPDPVHHRNPCPCTGIRLRRAERHARLAGRPPLTDSGRDTIMTTWGSNHRWRGENRVRARLPPAWVWSDRRPVASAGDRCAHRASPGRIGQGIGPRTTHSRADVPRMITHGCRAAVQIGRRHLRVGLGGRYARTLLPAEVSNRVKCIANGSQRPEPSWRIPRERVSVASDYCSAARPRHGGATCPIARMPGRARVNLRTSLGW
jgi:hypothetical protein